MPKVLISYRRSDSAAITGRIFDRLVLRYDNNSIFMDVDNIPFGIDFRTHIRDALLQSDLMLIVIGKHWLGRGEGTEARLNDESDPVRVEVESALKANIPIIPLLVDGAQMPKSTELPESIREIAYRNAALIDSGRDFHAHIERLIRSIDQIAEQNRKSAAGAAHAVASATALKQAEPPAVQSPPPLAPVAPDLKPRTAETASDSASPASESEGARVQPIRAAVTASGSEPLLQIHQVGKRFGGFVALDAIDLVVARGERLGLIGPNGSGKSTLVNCICGTLQNEGGSVTFDGRKIDGMAAHQRTILGLARSFQLPRPFHSLSVADNLRVPLLYAVKARLGPAITPRELDEHCVEYLRLVGLDHKAGKMPRDLTQVEMRKLELARAMAAEPKLLIADESMAGLSHSEIDDILKLLVRLNERGITIILIEHIMSAVMSFSQRLAVLVSGKKIADGNPAEVVRNPEVEKAYLG